MENQSFSLLNPILSAQAIKSRRYCIAMSLIALVIGLNQHLPSKFLLFDLNLESVNKTKTIWLIFTLTTVIFIDFISHAAPNIASFIAKYKAEYKYHRFHYVPDIDESDLQSTTPYTKMGHNITKEDYERYSTQDEGSISIFENEELQKWNNTIIFFCWIRIGIEFIIPSGITVWALYELLQLI